MTINVNSMIKVKLTKRGKQVHIDYYKELLGNSMPNADLTPSIDEEGYTRYQLWTFMRIFGPHFNIGTKPLIQNNEIHFGGIKIDG